MMRTISTIATALITLAPATAAAGAHELAFESGSLHNGDRVFDRFSNDDSMPSLGLRAAYALNDNFGIVAAWHNTRIGGDVYFGNSFIARQAFLAHDFSAGLKVDVPIHDLVSPYATLTAVGVTGTVKLDDDPDDADSPGQVQDSALSFGGRAAAGVDIHLSAERLNTPVGFGIHIDFGYQLLSRMQFSEFGSMKPGGFAMRAGLGVQF